jgi:hypothetical protein
MADEGEMVDFIPPGATSGPANETQQENATQGPENIQWLL